MTARFLIGTSGWDYDHWRGRFYPAGLPQRDWLRYCSERFPTVEVNTTFYRLPANATFALWHRAGFALENARQLTDRLKG